MNWLPARTVTMPLRLDDPKSPRVFVSEVYAESRNGKRITSTVFPDHQAAVLSAKPYYEANRERKELEEASR